MNSLIPQKGDGKIEMNLRNELIKIELPNEIENERGILTQSGMIIYNSIDKNVAVGVQQEKDGEDETLRILLNINKPTAPKAYTFNYNLPKNYKIIPMESYCKNDTELLMEFEYKTKGSLMIISETNEPVVIIESPWAKDKNGADINTFYSIKGNEITQHIDFNNDTVFPIVADPGHGTVNKYEEFVVHNVAISNWFEPKDQGTKGVKLEEGDAISYSPSGGGTVDVSLSVGAGYGAYSFGVAIGYAGKGESLGYIKRAKKAGSYKLKVKKAVDYDVYKKMMKWKENGEEHIMEYGRVGKNEKESVYDLKLVEV